MPSVVHSIMRSEIQDENTCEDCQQLDGIVLPADSPEWSGPLGAPAHCNCRYDLIPIVDGIDPVLEPTTADEIAQFKTILGTLQAASHIETMNLPLTGARRFQARQITIDEIEDLLEPVDLILRLFPEGIRR